MQNKYKWSKVHRKSQGQKLGESWIALVHQYVSSEKILEKSSKHNLLLFIHLGVGGDKISFGISKS